MSRQYLNLSMSAWRQLRRNWRLPPSPMLLWQTLVPGAVFSGVAGFQQAANRVLRYVARLDNKGNASVGLVELERTHAFANIRQTDNIVQFSTKRYSQNPLVVQGPGAGPDVTAAGVFADLLRVVAGLGARA